MRPLIFAAPVLLALHTPAEAAFTCGIYMCKLFGLQCVTKSRNLKLALEWSRFPRTSAHPGAVVVSARSGRALGGGRGGHVARIDKVLGPCEAIVRDNRGTYKRNICKRLVAIVQPTGNL